MSLTAVTTCIPEDAGTVTITDVHCDRIISRDMYCEEL